MVVVALEKITCSRKERERIDKFTPVVVSKKISREVYNNLGISPAPLPLYTITGNPDFQTGVSTGSHVCRLHRGLYVR